MTRSTVFAIAILPLALGACGDGSDDPIRSDGGITLADAAPLSPFVPTALDNVVESMVSAIEAKAIPSAARPPVAVLLKDLTGFWAPIVVGANRMSARLALASVVQAPLIEDQSVSEDTKGDLQNQYIDYYLASGIYQAMAVAPFSTSSQSVQHLDEFIAQRGPAVTIDSDSPTSGRSYLIATANYQAGVTAAKTLAKSMSPGQTVAVFGTTDPSWVSGMERANGAEAGVTAAGLTLAPRIPVVWKGEVDQAAIYAAITDPSLNIRGLLCMYSNSYLCAAAVEQANLKDVVKILAFDMETRTKGYFDQGYFVGVAVQRQFYMGVLGLLVPYSLVALGRETTAALVAPVLVDGYMIDTGIDIITTANYSDYMAYLNLLGINT